jgi:hypothetical protein
VERKTITAYIVQRLGWEYGDDWYYRREEQDAPVLTFLDRAKAEAHRRDCQWRHVCEQKINPFGYVDLALQERTSLPLPEFLDRLREAGMRAEVEGGELHDDFLAQYEKLPDEGRRLVWDAVDRVRFFTVVEMAVDLDE